MSVANCYTDFHLDFGGTSVWYHLIRGEKLFLLIPPSPTTYDMFHLWQLSGEQEGVFFADLIERAQFVRLSAGDTFIMPSGVFCMQCLHPFSDSLGVRLFTNHYFVTVTVDCTVLQQRIAKQHSQQQLDCQLITSS